ncbi:rhomboid family intramembrane serine protease [candidate division KSB1 bacterium]|nr:rhomboid family intramembrane serine protease [candidate division KSB1 bacterium]
MPEKKARNIGAILCPNCGKLINANSKYCIHCGLKYPGKQNVFIKLMTMFNKRLSYTKMIIYFCSGLYILSIIIDPSALSGSGSIFNLLSPSIYALDRLGMTGQYALLQGRFWTLVTAIYLHGGLLHILFNMLWIRQLGPMVEELFGLSRLILIFTISGVLGFLISGTLNEAYTIGASGSIFGLMGALIFYGRDRGGFFGQAIFKQLIGYAILLFAFGFLFSGINNWAHAGGFIGGYLTAKLLGYSERRPETLIHKNVASISLIITVLCFILAIWNGFF